MNTNIKIFIAIAIITSTIFGIAIGNISFIQKPTINNKDQFEWSDVNRISQQDKLNKILRLLKVNFDGDVLIKKYENGPSGTLTTNAEIDGQLRQFVLLADKETFVEGVIYSPYLSEKQITSQHSPKARSIASENQLLINKRNKLKQSFKQKQASVVNPNGLKTEGSIILKTEPLTLPEVNSIRTNKSKESLFQITKQLEFVEYGDTEAPILYVYFDYNCGGCRVVKKHLKKYIENGSINIRYIPVATRNEDSYVKAAYSLIPDNNQDRQTLFEYFAKAGTAKELITKKAPRSEFNKGIKHVKNANDAFKLLPNQLTPTFVFKLNGEVFTSSTTSTRKIEDIVNMVNN